MSTFKNISSGDLWLNSPDGTIKPVKFKQSFEGSNYYKQFTSPTMTPESALLTCTFDDGLPWVDVGVSQTIPNKLIAIEISVPPGSQWGDFDYDFTATNYLGAVARFVQITVESASIKVKINGQDSSIFTMDLDSVQSFNTNELLIRSIAFRNDAVGGSSSSVKVLAAAISNL